MTTVTQQLSRPQRPLTITGVPSSAGGYGPGQEHAPATFRRHGLIDALRSTGFQVIDRGDGNLVGWKSDENNPTEANADLVAAVSDELAETIADSLSDDHNVLVLGGDCTIELGTVAGALRDGSTVGLAYIDLDADLNTPATGDGILDWMGVAHVLAIPGAHEELASLGPRRPMLRPDAVRLFATNNITAPEQAIVNDLDLHIEPLVAVMEDTEQVTARTREWAKAFDRLLVHVDVDVLDYDTFPIAENTDRRGGLDLAALTGLLTDLCALPNWRALTLTEINPDHAPDERDSFRQLINVMTDALGPAAQSHQPTQGI